MGVSSSPYKERPVPLGDISHSTTMLLLLESTKRNNSISKHIRYSIYAVRVYM